jgi:predicted pyridoxine 5'-phosphate oxidase superfamily flavin-nucleotide-binding protein
MDYVHQRRLKIYGRARIVTAEEDPALLSTFADPGYDATVERAVLVTIEAFDWNCPQHITQRFTAAELEPHLATLRHQLSSLQAENAALREKLTPGAEPSAESVSTG